MPSITIEPPLGGINRSFGFQKQPLYTAIDILNMWPFNAADGRHVLATRPDLTAITSPGTGVNLLAQVTAGGSGKPAQGLVAAAAGSLKYWTGSGWTASGGAQHSSISTGRQVFASPLDKYLVIANDTDLLVYDYAGNSCATIVASAGTAPTGCPIITTHMGSIMVAGKSGQENVVFSSRTGDHTDWDTSQPATDPARAFATNLEVDGRVNEPISAMIQFTADQTIIAGPTSMRVMRGHLSRGGIVDVISMTIGVLGNNAWCLDGNGNLFFMSKSGLGSIPAGSNSPPVLVSAKKMPDSLRGIVYDYTNPNISMAYSARWNCIYIAVSGTQAQSWLYDIEGGGFFRMSFDVYPTVMMAFDPFVEFNKCGVLWGGTGYGGLAQFDRTGTETNKPNYHAFIGPIPMSGDPQHKAKLTYARVVLGANSNDDNGVVALYTGTDGEDAFVRAFNDLPFRRYLVKHKTLQQMNNVCNTSLAGSALMLIISGRAGHTTFEGATFAATDAGINRDLRVIGYGYDLDSGLDNYDPGMGGGWNSKFGDDGKPKYGKDGDSDDDNGSWGNDDDPYDPFITPATPGFVSISFGSFDV